MGALALAATFARAWTLQWRGAHAHAGDSNSGDGDTAAVVDPTGAAIMSHSRRQDVVWRQMVSTRLTKWRRGKMTMTKSVATNAADAADATSDTKSFGGGVDGSCVAWLRAFAARWRVYFGFDLTPPTLDNFVFLPSTLVFPLGVGLCLVVLVTVALFASISAVQTWLEDIGSEQQLLRSVTLAARQFLMSNATVAAAAALTTLRDTTVVQTAAAAASVAALRASLNVTADGSRILNLSNCVNAFNLTAVNNTSDRGGIGSGGGIGSNIGSGGGIGGRRLLQSEQTAMAVNALSAQLEAALAAAATAERNVAVLVAALSGLDPNITGTLLVCASGDAILCCLWSAQSICCFSAGAHQSYVRFVCLRILLPSTAHVRTPLDTLPPRCLQWTMHGASPSFCMI
jgi:hypothetical protein